MQFSSMFSHLALAGHLIFLTTVLTGLGLFVLKLLKVKCSNSKTKLFLAYAVGAGMTGYIVFILAAAQFLASPIIYTALAALIALSCLGWKDISNCPPEHATATSDPPERLATIGLTLLLTIAFILALTPEIGKDALVYHLAAPKLYLKHHGFFFIPGNIYSNIPFQTEMLYILALFLHGDTLAKGINFVALLVILLGIRQLAIDKYRITCPTLTMLIFASLPTIFELSHLSYADLYVALFTLGGVYAYITWQEHKESQWIILCGLFTGLAISTKYSAVIIPFIALFGILWEYRTATDARPLFRNISLYLIITAIAGSPFYLKNFLLTGNPVYPFMFQLFGGKGLDSDLARLFDVLYKYMGMGRTWIDYLLLPWNISFFAEMNSTRFDGVIGPVFLLILPLLLGIRNKDKHIITICAYCGICFLFWASSSQDIRYMTPMLPFLVLLIGVILTNYRQQRTIIIYCNVVIFGSLTFNTYHIVQDFMKINPLPVVMGIEDRETFLNRSLSPYKMYSFANNNLPAETRIFLINMKNYTYLCERDCYSDTMFETHTLQKILHDAPSGKEIFEILKGKGFSHLMYDARYLTGDKSILTSTEKNLFLAFQKEHLTLIISDKSYHLFSLTTATDL